MTYKEYKSLWLGRRINYDGVFGFQCVDLARDYATRVMGLPSKPFGGTAYKGWIRRNTVFPGKKFVEGFSANIPVGSIVIFKPNALVETKKPGILSLFWKKTRFTYAGHVAIVDYIDNDGVIRVLEQNGKGTGTGLGDDSIRLMGYRGKESVAGFILP